MNGEMTFRPMRRFKQQLPEGASVAILKDASRGFLSVVGEGGYPYTIPINFVYEDGHLFFHCAQQGHKMDAIRKCDKACFTVIGEPEQEPNDWWYHVKSVICRGRISVIEEDAERMSKLKLLGSKLPRWIRYGGRHSQERLQGLRPGPADRAYERKTSPGKIV